MVREAIGSALPVPRKKTERPRWKFAGCVAFVDGILELDRKAPRKQRHTAHRIWERMRIEFPECQVCERTIRLYVRKRKIALDVMVQETFVPQSYDRGAEAQVDWYEAYADLTGERTKLQVVRDAKYGDRSGIPLRVRPCDAAGLFGKPMSWPSASLAVSFANSDMTT